MKKTTIGVLLMTCLAFGFFVFGSFSGHADNADTLRFIQRSMTNKNGTLATYLKDETGIDSDEVRGREALSESVGLYLLYTLETNDQKRFRKMYRILDNKFLMDDGFIHWKLSKNGKAEVMTNALVDDLRIMNALYLASERWSVPAYKKTADEIGKFIGDHLLRSDTLVDFYDRTNSHTPGSLTLSYLDPKSLDILLERGHISQESFDHMLGILRNLPEQNGFYPKSYGVKNGNFRFEEEVNMIDQLIVASNRAQHYGEDTTFTSFLLAEWQNNGVVYGRYDSKSKKTTVPYESPASYSLMIQYAIQIDNKELALLAYERMIQFRTNSREYRGAYSVTEGNTHIFDNLLPLLSIEQLKNKDWIS
ncbi:glycosyl hydrolase family 8 [Halobacillus sp. BAB-2008]|uniref:glycosyl hydrolase family 8 n=1 Tax=Halobacillus sp. BAB-2008 TaxID=1246484 RepID=UPI0002A4F0FC|nr:glycosyl hydrolase family 8 [Halobacillus sp. BAB-2008]ELK48625.1 transcriptional regulator pfoR [Halobacillus sp. BAB-2008]